VKSNDLVTKNFFANGSFAVTTETKSGDYTFKSNVSGDSKKPVSATLEPKYEWKEHNLAFEGKISTANSATAKATFKNVVPGLSLHLQGDRALTTKDEETKLSQSATAGFTYVNEKVHLTGEAKVPVGGKIALTASLHAKPVDNFSVGLKADYEVSGQPKFEGKVIGGNDQTEGAVSVTFPDKVVGVNLWHSLNSNFQLASTVSWPPAAAEGKKAVAPTSVNVAGNYKFDDHTTLKAKLSAAIDRTEDAKHVYRYGLSLQQKVNDNVTVSVGTDVNLNHVWGLGSSGDDSSYGVQVAFK
jgi:hypothetical protein